MMKMRTVGVVLCVLLMAGAAHAAQSKVDVAGTLSYTGSPLQWGGGASGATVQASIDANDITEGTDSDPTSATYDGVSDSGSDSETWGLGWSSTSSSVLTWTATFNVNEFVLYTPAVGDLASAQIDLALELKNGSAILDSDYATVTSDPGAPVVLTVQTPSSGTVHSGDIVMSVTVNGEAFKATPVVVDDDKPAVPVPGAVLLSSLGAGLVGWLRRRRTL